MSKRRSEEARVLAYFQESPAEKAELMLGLVRDVVRRRVAPIRVTKVTAAPRQRSRKGNAATVDKVSKNVEQGVQVPF